MAAGISTGSREATDHDTIVVARPTTARRCARGCGRWASRIVLALVAYLVVGNLLILGTSVALQVLVPDGPKPPGITGVSHLRTVDDKVWRGSAPSEEGYASLQAAGVTTIVDLRASTTDGELEEVRSRGFDVVHLPVNDGEAPSEGLVEQLLAVVAQSPGKVFIHCQAGVGRTGSVVAAYAVRTGAMTGPEAMFEALSIGPPTMEQLVYMWGLRADSSERPPAPLVMASRVLDAPRQAWNRIFG